MRTDAIDSAAKPYAQSLIELAGDNSAASSLGSELGDLVAAIEKDPQLKLFFINPAIAIARREKVFADAFAGKLSPLLFNLLGVLNRKNRLALLPQVSKAYKSLLEEKLGRVQVDLTVAQKLSADQLEKVRHRVSSILKRDAILHQRVDEKIIGGMVLRIGDKLLDASVRAQLDALRNRLVESDTATK